MFFFFNVFVFLDDQPKIPPWEEEDGIYGIMVSYLLQRILICCVNLSVNLVLLFYYQI